MTSLYPGADDALCLGQSPGRREHLAEDGVEAGRQAAQVCDMLVRDDEQMDRGLRSGVLDCEAVIVSIEEVAGHVPDADPAEGTVSNQNRSLLRG